MIHWSDDRKFVEKEYVRLGFDSDSRWRISYLNKDFALCNSYPRFLIVPANFTDEDLESVAKFRYFGRIPTAVWRHLKNGCFIVRSSQPTVGWFGWFRSELDENLVRSYVSNTMPAANEQNNSLDISDNNTTTTTTTITTTTTTATTTPTITTVNTTSTDTITSTTNGNGPHNHENVSTKDQDVHHTNGNVCDAKTLVENVNKIAISDDRKPAQATTTMIPDNMIDSSKPQNYIDFCEFKSNNHKIHNNNIHESSQMLIIDARSYTAAMANRAKGGGCECSEYYPSCEVHFMNLANIHSIRKSYHAIRSACEAYSEQSNK